jgi:hypothetical protein
VVYFLYFCRSLWWKICVIIALYHIIIRISNLCRDKTVGVFQAFCWKMPQTQKRKFQEPHNPPEQEFFHIKDAPSRPMYFQPVFNWPRNTFLFLQFGPTHSRRNRPENLLRLNKKFPDERIRFGRPRRFRFDQVRGSGPDGNVFFVDRFFRLEKLERSG